MQVIFNWDIAGGTLRREMAVVAMCNIASGAYVMKVFNKSGASVLVFLDNVSEGYPSMSSYVEWSHSYLWHR